MDLKVCPSSVCQKKCIKIWNINCSDTNKFIESKNIYISEVFFVNKKLTNYSKIRSTKK